jgi:rhodanese-related sulfurtransferase
LTTTDPQPHDTATIDPAELIRMRVEDPAVHVVDVRTPGEFETGHIDGSYNVPLDLLGEHVTDLAALDHHVVLVCQSGARATKALEQLVAAGKSNLRLLEGGMSAWTASGNDVARTNATRWAMDRQVRLVAGSIVLASIVVSVLVPPARFVAGFIGAGLTFSALTDTCGMALVLAKLPYNRGAGCDMGAVLDQLTAAETSTSPGTPA